MDDREFPRNDTAFPIKLTAGQYYIIAGILLAAICSICLNLRLLHVVLKIAKGGLTAFDILLLNQLVVNVLSTLLIDPWDIIAYSVLQSGWPFSEAFCYFSRFCATCLPFISCWNIVVMALHHLLVFTLLDRHGFNLHAFLTSLFKRCTALNSSKVICNVIMLVPPFITWFVGLVIHAPITYYAWGISYQPGYCGIENLLALLHDGLGLFVAPAILGLAFVVALFVVKRVKHRSFPAVVEETPAKSPFTVTFQAAGVDSSAKSMDQPPNYAESPVWTVDQEYNHSSDFTDTDLLIPSPPPYEHCSWSTLPASLSTKTEATLREITIETVAIVCALLAGLYVFIGPYGIFALVLDNGLRVREDYSFVHYFWFFRVCFPWALAKPLFEPIIVLGILSARASAGKFKPSTAGRSCSEHAATINGHGHYSGR